LKLIRASVAWDEVAACWVRAELGSERFAHLFEGARADNPAATDTELLTAARGWPDTGYFEAFPSDVQWFLVALTRDEVAAVVYIDWEYWIDVTDGSRRPIDAIRKMGWDGAAMPPPETEPLILVTDDFDAPQRLVVLEGHSRLTAYMARRKDLPPLLECYLGVSAGIVNWGCF
jgi:hypothetical protein